MDFETWLRYLAAVTHGTELAGSYTPHTDPLAVMTGTSP